MTDRETVAQIQENAYMQYFIGYPAYRPEEPFDHSLLVTFRKRFSKEMLDKINERIVAERLEQVQAESSEEEADDSPCTPPSAGGGTSADETEELDPADDPRTYEEKAADNSGQLLVDATCTPADIPYPTDISLLNEAREKSEEIIDHLHKPHKEIRDKPRTYRERAHKEYIAFSKQRKPDRKKIRKAIRKQLGYLKRNLATINTMAVTLEPGLSPLSKLHYKLLLVITEVYRQQQYMYDNKVHTVKNRIVNNYQPHVRPIVRGKAGTPTEFGAKISVSLKDGYSFVYRLSWEAYNESGDLPEQIELYKQRHGCYPESAHVDKLYRTRENRKYCRDRGIRLSGPKPGRPPKETEENKEHLFKLWFWYY